MITLFELLLPEKVPGVKLAVVYMSWQNVPLAYSCQLFDNNYNYNEGPSILFFPTAAGAKPLCTQLGNSNDIIRVNLQALAVGKLLYKYSHTPTTGAKFYTAVFERLTAGAKNCINYDPLLWATHGVEGYEFIPWEVWQTWSPPQ